jgi:DNA-directed RNA polymerase specialized sigma subunit
MDSEKAIDLVLEHDNAAVQNYRACKDVARNDERTQRRLEAASAAILAALLGREPTDEEVCRATNGF